MPGWVNRYAAFDYRVYAQPIVGGGYDDGWDHPRGEDGWCLNCGAPPGTAHARLVRKATMSPILGTPESEE